MINLWQLHVFLVVNETGSFSAAANRLHMTQPGVSQQIRALETHLGTKLFVRRGHGVEMTAAGYDLVDPARRLINLSETTERTLMSRRGEVSGRIRLGSALLSGAYICNPWLLEFRNQYPDVTIQVEQVEPGPLLGALRAQELDAGLVLGRLRGRGLVHHKLLEDPVTLIVPLNHPWSWPADLARAAEPESESAGTDEQDPQLPRHSDENSAPSIKLSMLKDQPLVLEHAIGESHSDARRALTDQLEERNMTTRDLRVVLEVPSPVAVAFAVSEGIGVGLVPQSVARRFVGQVIPVRIEGFTLAQHVYLIHDRKALHSPAVQAWWKFVNSTASQRAAQAATDEPPDEPPREAKRVTLTEPVELTRALPLRSLTSVKG
jgi:DNA-binding transcriptional LysR family regulator